MHVMEVLDHTGHTSINWDPDNPAEVETARQAFERMTREGYRAFTAGNGKPGRRLDAFDPEIGEMTLIPHLRGG